MTHIHILFDDTCLLDLILHVRNCAPSVDILFGRPTNRRYRRLFLFFFTFIIVCVVVAIIIIVVLVNQSFALSQSKNRAAPIFSILCLFTNFLISSSVSL